MPGAARSYRMVGVAVATLLVSAACGSKDSPPADARQITLAPQAAAEPQLADRPLPAPKPEGRPEARDRQRREPTATKLEPVVEPTVSAPAPAAAPAPLPVPKETPAPEPAMGMVESGTSFTVRPETRICTNTHKPGDRFTATLAEPVHGSNGVTIPAGATAILRVVEPREKASSQGEVSLAFDIVSIRYDNQAYEVAAHVTHTASAERINSQSNGDKAKKVGAGAAIGAIAGRILGGNTRSTVVGGVVGAAAGAAVAASDNHYETCLSGDGAITLAFDRPLVLRLPQRP